MVAPHCYGVGIGLAATLHWATLITANQPREEPVWIEVDLSPNPARDVLLADCGWYQRHGSSLTIPTGPGLGVDPERIAPFRVA
jgi:L-alanine-DL-glutamate epimerase-like enolase superfamily enzyme